jgi:acetyl-CoA carboxylase biotin carboxyl carrier protein
MNLKEVRELIELVSEKGIAEFEMERQGFRLRICRDRAQEQVAQYVQPAPVIVPSSAPVYQEPAQTPAAATAQAAVPQAPAKVEEPVNILTSPIVGTFYRSPTPDSPAFVEVGSHVKKGQVLCIIEAMKLMNEIESDVDGTIVEIYPQNGQAVEYGQPLFAFKV